MKLISIIIKSLKEQFRSFWILLLTLSMAPFFMFVYYLIYESSKPHYTLLLENQDRGIVIDGQTFRYSDGLMDVFNSSMPDSMNIPFSAVSENNHNKAIEKLKNRDADALLIIPADFSEKIKLLADSGKGPAAKAEIVGDLTKPNYIITVVFAGEFFSEYIHQISKISRPVTITETPLGFSGKKDEFSLYVPGLLVLSVIMLMFTATIAMVTEAEQGSLLRIKMSRVRTWEFLTGISIVQVLIGVLTVFITLGVAMCLGFNPNGAFGVLLLISIISSISIIGFSLIIAGLTKSANEVLVIGNFPLLLFMFFSGSMFPMSAPPLFSFMNYEFSIIGLMSTSHAISALNKVMIMGMGIRDILPEIISMLGMTIVYFTAGAWLFGRKHMRVHT